MGRYLAVVAVIIVAGLVVFSDDDQGSGLTDDLSLPSAHLDEEGLISTISHGEQVEIEDHLVNGQWTVVEFTADW